jgi:hypothetical protein
MTGRLDRRTFIGATVGVTVAIAGCSSSGGDSESGNGNGGSSGNGNGEETGGNGNGSSREGTDIQSMTFGETKEGYIDDDEDRDPKFNNLAEGIEFDGQAGQGVSITMRSDQIDPYLILTGPAGEVVADNDDGADGVNSRIERALPSTGTYTIWATTRITGETGPYTLSLEEIDFGERADLRTISYGEKRDGYVDPSDGRDPVRDDLAEPVEFEGEEGEATSITMRSDDLDSYLILVSPDGSILAEDDDSADGVNSRIELTLPSTGTYTIWAVSRGRDSTGPYTLRLETVDFEGRPNPRSISFGETKEGYVDSNDETGPEGRDMAEPVEFDGEEGQNVRITMRSDDIDPYLFLVGPDGSVVAENDDAAGDFNSQIEHTLESTGTYTIWATTFSGSDTGPYALTLEEL